LPKRPADLFTEAYLRDVVTNPEHPLRVALAENDLHTWTPQEAILLVHSKQDETVPYTNSEILRENFASRGTQVTLVPLPGEHSHVGGFLPALKIAASHFYPFLDRPRPRQGGTPI